MNQSIKNILDIAIITYKSSAVIKPCLEKLCDSSDLDIFVIDNASQDSTPQILKENFPQVNLIQNSKNIGYGRAANIMLKQTKKKYVLLLNPDTKISYEDIEKLVLKAEAFNDTAIFAPQTKVLTNESGFNTNSQHQEVTWVSGGAMLLRVDILQKTGFFDENIFLFYEETELCDRVRRMGYKIILFNDIYFYHEVGGSSGSEEKINILKYFHFGWSKIYYTKCGLQGRTFKFYTKSFRILFKYSLKFLVNSLLGKQNKKLKYKSLTRGAIACLKGISAIDENGNPRS